MAKEDKKSAKPGSFDSSEQIIQALEEILSGPAGPTEFRYSSRSRDSTDVPPQSNRRQEESPVSAIAGEETDADFLKEQSEDSPLSKDRNKGIHSHASYTYGSALHSLFINVLLFASTFFLLTFVMLIPGFTRFNRLYFYSEVSIELLDLPLWLNTGCAIGAVAILVRLMTTCPKCTVGLVIGIPVSLTALLSNYMEGYVGNGILFGFGTSILCVVLMIRKDVHNLGLKDIFRICCVAGLSILAILGPALHFFAALIIGFLIFLGMKAVLSVCIPLIK